MMSRGPMVGGKHHRSFRQRDLLSSGRNASRSTAAKLCIFCNFVAGLVSFIYLGYCYHFKLLGMSVAGRIADAWAVCAGAIFLVNVGWMILSHNVGNVAGKRPLQWLMTFLVVGLAGLGLVYTICRAHPSWNGTIFIIIVAFLNCSVQIWFQASLHSQRSAKNRVEKELTRNSRSSSANKANHKDEDDFCDEDRARFLPDDASTLRMGELTHIHDIGSSVHVVQPRSADRARSDSSGMSLSPSELMATERRRQRAQSGSVNNFLRRDPSSVSARLDEDGNIAKHHAADEDSNGSAFLESTPKHVFLPPADRSLASNPPQRGPRRTPPACPGRAPVVAGTDSAFETPPFQPMAAAAALRYKQQSSHRHKPPSVHYDVTADAIEGSDVAWGSDGCGGGGSAGCGGVDVGGPDKDGCGGGGSAGKDGGGGGAGKDVDVGGALPPPQAIEASHTDASAGETCPPTPQRSATRGEATPDGAVRAKFIPRTSSAVDFSASPEVQRVVEQSNVRLARPRDFPPTVDPSRAHLQKERQPAVEAALVAEAGNTAGGTKEQEQEHGSE